MKYLESILTIGSFSVFGVLAVSIFALACGIFCTCVFVFFSVTRMRSPKLSVVFDAFTMIASFERKFKTKEFCFGSISSS